MGKRVCGSWMWLVDKRSSKRLVKNSVRNIHDRTLNLVCPIYNFMFVQSHGASLDIIFRCRDDVRHSSRSDIDSGINVADRQGCLSNAYVGLFGNGNAVCLNAWGDSCFTWLTAPADAEPGVSDCRGHDAACGHPWATNRHRGALDLSLMQISGVMPHLPIYFEGAISTSEYACN